MPPPDWRRGLGEAWRSALAHRGSTLVVALIAAMVGIAVVLSAGRAAALEEQVAADLEAAAPRLIEVTVMDSHAGLDPAGVRRIEQLDSIEWALALGSPLDVRNAVPGVGKAVAARTLLGTLPPEVRVAPGRLPAPGEMIVGEMAARSLGMLDPAGATRKGQHSFNVVGGFSSSGALESLDRLALVGADPDRPGRATLIYVLAREAGAVPEVVRQIEAVVGIPQDALVVTTSDELIAVGEVLGGTTRQFSRDIALGAVGAGMLLMALAIGLALSARRRDFGRRRALGASRSSLVALTLAEMAVPVGIGAVAGVGVGMLTVTALVGQPPPLLFAVGAILLIAMAGMASALVPTIVAARTDPLRILRVP